MYPHGHSLNPINVAEGGTPYTSYYGAAILAARIHGLIHRTFEVANYLPHEELLFPARVGYQRNPTTPKPILPRLSYGYTGPVLIGPADANLY